MSRNAQRTASNVSEDGLLPSAGSKSAPGATANVSSGGGGLALQKAFEVNAFKMVNGQYQLQGRMGVALLSHTAKTEFKLLIYASGNAVVTQAVVTPNFSISVPQKLYVSFYDALSQNWSLLFDSADKMEDFLQRLTMARFRMGNASTVVSVDLRGGEGNPVAVGDSVEFRYTGWVVENQALGAVFETTTSASKPQRVKLGKSKTLKAWSEGLVGMKKDGRRFLVVPPGKAYGSKGLPPKIPPNSSLFFDVELVRAKFQSQSDVGFSAAGGDHSSLILPLQRTLSNASADDTPLPQLPADDPPEDLSVKDRTRSISEKLELPSSTSSKTDLLTRMAKMGQSIIPKTAPSQESDEGEDTTATGEQDSALPPQTQPIATAMHKVVQPIPKVPQRPDGPPDYAHQAVFAAPAPVHGSSGYLADSSLAMHPAAAMMSSGGQLIAYQSAPPRFPQPMHMFHEAAPLAPPQPTATDQLHTAMLVNETRQNNTEVRIAIGKLQEKVDRLMEKVGDQQRESQMARIGPTVPIMEASVLQQNLSRIIQENERLKTEVYEKSQKIEAQNQKILELLSRNQSVIEESNVNLEKNSTSFKASAVQSQAKVLTLEEEKLQLVKDLSQRTSEVYNLQLSLDEQKAQFVKQKNLVTGLQGRLETSEEELARTKLTCAEVQESVSACKAREKELKEAKRQLERRVESFEEMQTDLEGQRTDVERVLKDRLTKVEEDKRSLISQLDAVKAESEKEIEDLREKLRQERASVYSDSALKQNQIEEEITERWKKRCDQLVKAEAEKLERRIREVEEDRGRLETDYDTAVGRLEAFKTQSREMKSSLVGEVNRLTAEVERLTEEADEQALTTKIRGIMNAVFFSIRQKIAGDKRYDGATVHRVVMEVIKKTTLRLTGQSDDAQENESEEEDEVNSEEELSEEEEEDESEVEEQEEEKNRDHLRNDRPTGIDVPDESVPDKIPETISPTEICSDQPPTSEWKVSAGIPAAASVLSTEPPPLGKEVEDMPEPSPVSPTDDTDAVPTNHHESNETVQQLTSSLVDQVPVEIIENHTDINTPAQESPVWTPEGLPDVDTKDEEPSAPVSFVAPLTVSPPTPAVKSMEADKPLFSDDEDDGEFLGQVISNSFKPPTENPPLSSATKKDAPLDDVIKPQPPPLFADSEDDDDMGWLK